MPPSGPRPSRPVAGKTLRAVIERLATVVAEENGISRLRALADIRAAVEASIRREIWGGRGDTAVVLARLLGGPRRGPTWRQVGEDLGVSAQAAHRRYGPIKMTADEDTTRS